MERLKADPADHQGLLVLTMTDGMEADYDALIVKKQMAGLGLTQAGRKRKRRSCWQSIPPRKTRIWRWARATTSSAACRATSARSCGSAEFTATAKKACSSCSAPPTTATTCSRSPKPGWRWHTSASISPIAPASCSLQLAAEFPANPLYAKELALARPSCRREALIELFLARFTISRARDNRASPRRLSRPESKTRSSWHRAWSICNSN